MRRTVLRCRAGCDDRVGYAAGALWSHMELASASVRIPDRCCALVLRGMNNNSADLELLYFDGSKASLKEKLFIQEMLDKLLEVQSRRQT